MQLIINADDFGCSHTINKAIILAHQQGILTSTSLMVSGEAADEAIHLAQTLPSLAVGLHIVLVSGRAVLPPKEIPHLVDQNGNFPNNPLVAGLRCGFNSAVRAELKREIEAQFDRFVSTGLLLDHVDSHEHFHIHPSIFPVLLSYAREYGARGLRLPHDVLSRALKYDSVSPGLKIVWALFFGFFDHLYRPQAKRADLTVTDHVFGLYQTGQMREEYVLNLLNNMHPESAEIFFHPDTAEGGPALGPNPGDLATLLSSSVREAVYQGNITLSTYTKLKVTEHGI